MGTPHSPSTNFSRSVLVFLPPGKLPTARVRARHRALGFLCRSCGPSVRGRRHDPTRLEACSSDAAWASFRSPIGPTGSCHSLGYGTAHGTCSFRLRARRLARVLHAETARVRPEAVLHRPAVHGRRVAFALIAGGKVELCTSMLGLGSGCPLVPPPTLDRQAAQVPL